MKHKILALALAGALAVPQVGFAAEDSTGMRYDSASEGLYGSLRVIYRSKQGNEKDRNGVIEADTSRWGFQGTADMGSGLTGVYRFEQQLGGNDGEANGNVRLHYVGVKGGFGEVQAGSVGNPVYGIAYSYADASISGGGNYYGTNSRLEETISYKTPSLNGFQGAAYLNLDGTEAVGGSGDDKNHPTAAEVRDDNNIDRWGIGGAYGVRGFKVGAGYEVWTDGYINSVTGTPASKQDKNEWHISGQYAQDNWKVAVDYGQTNTTDNITHVVMAVPASGDGGAAACTKYYGSDGALLANGTGACEDQTTLAALGSIDIGKVGMRVELNNHSDFGGKPGMDRQVVSFGGEYRFSAKTKAYAAYISRDYDDDTSVEDSVVIGMRVDF